MIQKMKGYDTKNEGLYLNHSCSSGPPQW